MSLAMWLSIIGVILGVSGALGIAYAVLRSNVATKTIDLWKQQAEAMEERYNTEKDMRHDCETDLSEAFDRIEKLEDVSKALGGLIAENIDKEALKVLADLGLEKMTRRRRRGDTPRSS